jgi:antiviral helicase SKI2
MFLFHLDSNNTTTFLLNLQKPGPMTDDLLSALERVQLSSEHADVANDWIDSILDDQRPRKRIKQDREALKHELEEKFLNPSTSFSPEWLNKLQQ